jgi:hypothetical protein
MTEKPRNAMQAVLDRAAQAEAPPLSPTPARASIRKPSARTAPPSKTKTFERPSRQNTRLIGGHFPPELARQLRILAAEEDTTMQALLEEAINLLLAKKARGRLAMARSEA